MWNIQRNGLRKGTSLHAQTGDIGDALFGVGRPRHQLVSSDNEHGERWQIVESPTGKGQARRTYPTRN